MGMHVRTVAVVTASLQQKDGIKFSPRAYDLASHKSLAWVTVPVMRYSFWNGL